MELVEEWTDNNILIVEILNFKSNLAESTTILCTQFIKYHV